MTRRVETAALGAVAFLVASVILFFNLSFTTSDSQFLWLADAFLHGSLALPRGPVDAYSLMDVTVRGGQYFWPLGPLPAILLMPFAALFGQAQWSIAVLQLALAAAIVSAAFALARRHGLSARDAAWSVLALCGGSVAVGALALHGPWQLGHAVVLAAVLAALLEQRGKDRPEMVGALAGLALASRLTAVVALAYFGVETLLRPVTMKERLTRLARMAAPIVVVLALLGAYNVARFGSPFDNGYADSHLDVPALAERRSHGLFSLRNVGRNAWYYFLAPPSSGEGWRVVDPEGISFFVVSPAFLFAFLPPKSGRRKWLAGMAAFVAAMCVFLPYYTTGFRQFGPRYLNDVLPFLYLLLLDRFARAGVGDGMKAVIAVSCVTNAAFFFFYFMQMVS